MNNDKKQAPVYFIGAGPGDPELITLKGRRLLDCADVVIYAGSLVNPELLSGISAEIHNSASMDLDTIIDVISQAYTRGMRVVRLHTGDPCLYGAIGEQMRRLDKLGIPHEVIPGVSSAMAAAASIKAELTVPEVTQTVIFTRQAGRTPVPPAESLKNLAAARASMCIFLSVSAIETVVSELRAGGYPADTPAAVVEKASWPEERIIRGNLETIADMVKEAGIRKTAMILVGRAIGDSDSTESRLYHRSFSHEYRKIS
jgi:precorrin-4/cobalt-precorrin-4 C11-methyltransferase